MESPYITIPGFSYACDFGVFRLSDFNVPETNMNDEKVIEILNRANLSLGRFDYLDRLREMYPEQVRIAEINFYDYFRDITPL